MATAQRLDDDGSGPYRHCLRCGGGLSARRLAPHEPSRLVCDACGFVFYLDPKVAVGAIFESAGGIVLLRRGIEPGYGRWVFPGGYVDRGETLEAAARREALEEVNAEIRITRLLNAYSYAGRPVVVVVYAAEAVGGALRAGEEAIEVRAFEPKAIPWDDLAFPSTRDALRDFLNQVPEARKEEKR
ncbi:MAG: NUDIX hydrolase [Acidobacteria bacterium]|nr:MAG: NUDIX hydrolase [Acidobacteriota bacterium]